MKKILIAGCLLSAMVYSGTALAASADSAWYVELHGGGNWVRNTNAGANDPNGNRVSYNANYQLGKNIDAVLGYHICNGFDVQGQVGYLRSTVDSVRFTDINGTARSRPTGLASTMYYMLNGTYHFDTDTAIVPFVGVGIGYADPNYDLKAVDPTLTDTFRASGRDGAFAYQGIVGAAYKFNDCWSASLDFRYLATKSSDYKIVDVSGHRSIKVNGNFETKMVNLGVRYTFI